MRALRLVPPLRRHFEELEIKPKNNFRRGLFARRAWGRRLRRGGLFPQGLVRATDGSIGLSDDALGDRLTLVGFGVDPRAQLDQATQRQWERCGGGYLQVGLHGQKPGTSTSFVEDIGQALLSRMPECSLAVIRPDRIVMHEGPHARATQIVRESLALLGH
jgi:3-(3-hydroxy-phenyl)propionate hydroxylase